MGRGDGADWQTSIAWRGPDRVEAYPWPPPWSTPPLSYFRRKGVSEAYDKFTTSVPLGEEVRRLYQRPL